MARDDLALIEQDFMAAIDRLMAGAPTNQALAARAAKGCLLVNLSTVAMEAGRSRTLIATDPARLPRVRERVVALYPSKESGKDRDVRLDELVELRSALGRALVAQAELAIQRDEALRDAARWRDAFRRKEEATAAASNVVGIR